MSRRRTSKNQQSYRDFMADELRNQRQENPHLDQTEIMRRAASAWNDFKMSHGIGSNSGSSRSRSGSKSRRSSSRSGSKGSRSNSRSRASKRNSRSSSRSGSKRNSSRSSNSRSRTSSRSNSKRR